MNPEKSMDSEQKANSHLRKGKNVKDLFSLKGKNAVIIGGAGGIGNVIAQALAAFGAEVAIASRNEDSLKKGTARIQEATGKEAAWFQVDASDPESIRRLADKTEEIMGHVDILVNSQGYNKKYTCWEFPLEEWQKHMDLNVTGVMVASVEFARRMKERKWGRIINVSSIRGLLAAPGGGGAMAYGTTKAAVNMLTKQLAVELAQDGITVNAICPTVVMTPMMKDTMTPEFKAKMEAKIPMGRIATPQDCVGQVILFASDAGGYLTGHIAGIDGGLASL